MNCGDCLFGRKPGSNEFEHRCHRYPIGEFVGVGDWCGEYKSLPKVNDGKPILTLNERVKR